MGHERRGVKEWLKTVDRYRALQSANFNLSQVMQTSAIVGQLSPAPVPAFIVPNPSEPTGTTPTT